MIAYAIIYKSLLRKYGISVISMNEQIDDTPAGKLLEGIIEVIDEFYSLNLAEDTIRGLLSGLVYCGKCGAKMIGASAKSGHNHYYACNNYLKRGRHVCDMKMA